MSSQTEVDHRSVHHALDHARVETKNLQSKINQFPYVSETLQRYGVTANSLDRLTPEMTSQLADLNIDFAKIHAGHALRHDAAPAIQAAVAAYDHHQARTDALIDEWKTAYEGLAKKAEELKVAGKTADEKIIRETMFTVTEMLRDDLPFHEDMPLSKLHPDTPHLLPVHEYVHHVKIDLDAAAVKHGEEFAKTLEKGGTAVEAAAAKTSGAAKVLMGGVGVAVAVGGYAMYRHSKNATEREKERRLAAPDTSEITR